MAFFSDITLGQYYPGDSAVHRLDPRCKLFAALCLITSLMLSYSPLVLAALTLMLLLIIHLARLPFALVVKNLRPFLWLFAVTWIIHLFWTSGRILWIIPGVNAEITWEGAVWGGIYVARLALLIAAAALLTLTTAPLELADALERIFRPLKRFRVPAHELSLMLTLSLRFIPTLMEEALRIRNAQMSRGARFDGSLLNRVRSLLPLMVPLFVSAFRRADELAQAMDARCYNGGDGRTTYTRLHFSLADYGVCFSAAILIFVCMVY